MKIGLYITTLKEKGKELFDHWKINDRLEELGWPKHQIPYFKQGIADAIVGEWRDDFMCYNYGLDVKAPPDEREEAYTAGHMTGEELARQWLGLMSQATNTLSGCTTGATQETQNE